MLILLDQSPKKIATYSRLYRYEFGQLRTPLTGYQWCERPYAIDNGCYTSFNQPAYLRLVEQAKRSLPFPIFVALPDVVGNAKETIGLFHQFKFHMGPLPKALVLQDGIEDCVIPWDELQAVFVGGTTNFKESDYVRQLCQTAKRRGRWVHIGRVNTASRVLKFAGIADSIDGSGISRYDHMLEAVLGGLKDLQSEQRVEIRHMFIAKPCTICGASDPLPEKEKPSQQTMFGEE